MSVTLELIERLAYRTVHNTRRNHGAFLTLSLAAFFRAQGMNVSTHSDEMTIDNSDSVFDEYAQVDHSRLERSLMLAFLAGMLWGARRYDTGFIYDEATLSVVAYRNRILDLIVLLDATTKRDLKDVLTASVDASLSPVETKKAIQQLFVSYETQRSAQAGQYESLLAFNRGNFQSIVDTSVSYDKLWLTADDNRVEQECLDNAAQGWVGLSVSYNTGGLYPPAHIGCRCALDFRKA